MFSRRTVFVVGAGASKEVNLPTGIELSARISRLLSFEFEFGRLKNGDYEFFESTRKHLKIQRDEISAFLTAANQVAESVQTVNSIDNYIDIHRHNNRVAACGKAAIVYAILRAEKSSLLWKDLHVKSKLELGKIENTWLVEFGRVLVNEVPLSQIETIFSNISIICFNYDRVIEEFIAQWLSQVYSITREKSEEITRKLKIFRPYGSVGDMFSNPPFGHDPIDANFWAMSSRIKTYTEQIQDENLIGEMRLSVAEADILVFLGFGFHRQNLKLISPEKRETCKSIFASGYGFSSADTKTIANELTYMFQRNIPIQFDGEIYIDNQLTCHGIFSTFRRSLNPT